MTLLIDQEYLLLTSNNLERFARVNQRLWRFRCPFCGDSARRALLARCYVYPKGDELRFFCHNCNKSGGISQLLEQVNPMLRKQYVLDNFINRDKNQYVYQPQIAKALPIETSLDFELPTIEELPDNHRAKKYLAARKIPEFFWNQLYFANDFKQLVTEKSPDQAEHLHESDGRIILPLYSKENALFGFSGRSLEPKADLRYITIKLNEAEQKVFGMERLDESKKVIVVEGGFDSLFLPNCIATFDSNLNNVDKILKTTTDYVLVFDNEPRNFQIINKMQQAQRAGKSVVVWSKEFRQTKDINAMILAGLNPLKHIEKNTFNGLRLKLEIDKWKEI